MIEADKSDFMASIRSTIRDAGKLKAVMLKKGLRQARAKCPECEGELRGAAAGLGPDVTPHVLRHSCASWLLWGRPAKGARPATPPLTIWDVAGVIGADDSTVERTYGHHMRIEMERRTA